MTDCLFCKIANGEIDADMVLQNDEMFAIRDISPQAPVHVLVIPRRHIATLNDLQDGDAELVGRMVLAAEEIACNEGLAESGYRLVWNCQEGAGQSVFHIHLHVLGGRPFLWPPG